MNSKYDGESVEDAIWSKDKDRITNALSRIDASIEDQHGRTPLQIAQATRDENTIWVVENLAIRDRLKEVADSSKDSAPPHRTKI